MIEVSSQLVQYAKAVSIDVSPIVNFTPMLANSNVPEPPIRSRLQKLR